MVNNCSGIQKSVEWCEGACEPSGVQGRIYYISDSDVKSAPELPVDAHGRPTSATLTGEFVLAEDAVFMAIDGLTTKAQHSSEAQGEYPNQTQLNKLTVVHPGVGPEASALPCYVNNTRCWYVFRDMRGRWRVLGSKRFHCKSTITQDNGQGETGETGTTLAAQCTGITVTPFYTGKLLTVDGEIDCSDNAA